jgi:hypothetical protein
LGPIRTGFFYGLAAALIALVAELRFLLIDPREISTWVFSVFETFRNDLALAACFFLGILAALRVRPTRLDEGVPYRSILLRDGALAATVVAVMFGAAIFLTTALQATVLSDETRSYAERAAPRIVAYQDELARRFDDPRPATVAQIESDLQPPAMHDLGRSISNLVLRTLFVGFAGAMAGLLRGRSGREDEEKPGP